MLDTWEGQYFGGIDLCDPGDAPDNDRYTNLEEFQHGTDPTVFDAYLLHTQAIELMWKSTPGRYYQIQASTNLISGEWFDVGDPIEGDGTTQSILESTRYDASKVYRVQVLP
jgi:hypothetical protein